MWAATCIAALFIIAVPTTASASCANDLGSLEQALFQTGSNLFELNRIFFPPSLLPTRFVRVEYSFMNPSNHQDCNVTYIWAVGEVLFLQPPSLFKINSLFFYYPNNELTTLHLQLPIECIPLINGTDGECTCRNDSHMLDILTQQLNIYARFTAQENVQRTNTFARAICAGELHDIYYSGKDKGINYIIAAATIVGPILLVLVSMAFIILGSVVKILKNIEKKKKTSSVFHSTKRKNLVALILLGIYITIYIFVLDIIAANIVRTSSHEYARELSPRNISFNLGVTYFTLTCDLLAVVELIVVLILIIIRYFKDIKYIQPVEDIFPYLLIAPSICITSHLGYIMLAWITQPSRSTTTLILYYFLFSYMYLMFRKTYKLGQQSKKSFIDKLRQKRKCKYSTDSEKQDTPPTESREMQALKTTKSGVSIDTPPTESRETAPKPADSDSPTSGTSTPPKESSSSSPAENASTPSGKQKGIDVCLFFLGLLLGVFYLGVAVVFIMMIYLMPLASEDLFSYLFNVIQFMIVVVSTQFAYKLIVGKEFCIKKIIKHIKEIAIQAKVHEPPSNDEGIAKEIGKFLAEKLLIPIVRKNMTKSQPITPSQLQED